MSNVSSNGNGRQSPHVASETEEKHEFQCHSLPVPVQVARLVMNGTISRAHAWLLAIVAALVKPGERGCYATNRYLAKCCDVTVRQIQLELSHLRDLGLIRDSREPVMVGGHPVRTIETEWASADPPRRIHRDPTKDSSCPPTKDSSPNKEVDDSEVLMGKAGRRKPLANARVPAAGSPPGGHPLAGMAHDLLDQDAVKGSWGSRCAAKLYKAVSGAHHVISYKSAVWAASFNQLGRTVKPEQIEAALEWYCANPDKWVIMSAAGFVRCFATIVGLSRRYGSAPQPPSPPNVIISPEAQEVVDDLKTMGWPKGSADQLPPLVSSSHVAMKNLYDKLEDILARLDRGKVDGIDPTQPAQANVLRTFLERFMADMGQDAESATARWWRDVHKKVAGWRDWSGQLKSYVFSIEHARFKAILREASYSFSHDEDLATLVLREINRP